MIWRASWVWHRECHDLMDRGAGGTGMGEVGWVEVLALPCLCARFQCTTKVAHASFQDVSSNPWSTCMHKYSTLNQMSRSRVKAKFQQCSAVASSYHLQAFSEWYTHDAEVYLPAWHAVCWPAAHRVNIDPAVAAAQTCAALHPGCYAGPSLLAARFSADSCQHLLLTGWTPTGPTVDGN